jgi:peptide-methionine (S)-S-oxide reductase
MDDLKNLDSLFREAVSAMDAGDVATLERLLAANPQLVRDRLDAPGAWLRDIVGGALDGFFKDPYLLWFLAEDPVRTGKMPRNVAQMARAIIRAAERERVDTLPEQLEFTLHLAVCSGVERESGLQLELIDVLLDAGTSPNRTIDCLVNGNFAAAEHLLSRGAEPNLATVMCLDRWEDVRALAPTATPEDKQVALTAAALHGKVRALEELIALGVDLDAFSSGFYSHATPLHHAVWSASLDAVKVIVDAGARLDTKDKANNATPLGWAEYGAKLEDERAPRYAEIAAYLREKNAPQ